MRLRPRSRRRTATLAGLLAPLPLLACKPAVSAPVEPVAAPAPVADAEPPVVVEPAAPPPAVVYAHVRIPSPAGLVSALRSGPLLPEAQRGVVEDSFIRSMLAMAIPQGSKFSQGLDLTRPMGCVVTSFRLHDVPLACVVGYRGGLTQLVRDLGPEGYLNGADDHAAYRLEGRSVFLAAIGDHVAFAFAPDLIAATRDRLQRDLVDAPIGEEDFVVAAFPDVIFADAEEQILAGIDRLTSAPAANPMLEAVQQAQREQYLSWRELERAELWLDVTPARVRLGYRGTALPGSATERSYAASRGIAPIPTASTPMARLPASPLVAMGMRLDLGAMLDDPTVGMYTKALGNMQGSGPGMLELYQQSMKAYGELSTGHVAAALLHERGTKGGVVFVYDLRPGIDAKAVLRELMRGAEASPPSPLVTFELRTGALRVGKDRADLVTIEPRASAGPKPMRIEMAYVQRGETLYVAMATGKVDRYLRRALAAADGKDPLGRRSAARAVLEAQATDSVIFTASMAGLVRWLDQIDAIAPVTVPIPERFDDVVVAVHPAGERQREVTYDVSATMLDALYRLSSASAAASSGPPPM